MPEECEDEDGGDAEGEVEEEFGSQSAGEGEEHSTYGEREIEEAESSGRVLGTARHSSAWNQSLCLRKICDIYVIFKLLLSMF